MRRAGWWALLWLLRTLVLADVLVILGAIADSAERTETLGEGLDSILVLLLIGVGTAAAARTVHHHLNRHHRPHRTSASEQADRDRLDHRANLVITVVALVVLAVVEPFWVKHAWTSWRTSVETQDHELGADFTVDQVTRVSHGTGHGGYFSTTHLEGELEPPVEGRTRTTVYIPDSATYLPHEQFPVLVDPQDPSHAERPGLEAYPGRYVVGVVGLAVVNDLALVLLASRAVAARRSRSRGAGDRARWEAA